jgi:hypothetical protein
MRQGYARWRRCTRPVSARRSTLAAAEPPRWVCQHFAPPGKEKLLVSGEAARRGLFLAAVTVGVIHGGDAAQVGDVFIQCRFGCTRAIRNLLNIGTATIRSNRGNWLPDNRRIEVAVQWPYLLYGTCPLKLVMKGRIVRASRLLIGIEAKSIEFRTARTAARAGVQ